MKTIDNLIPRKATTSNTQIASNLKDNADITDDILHKMINNTPEKILFLQR